MTRQLRVALGLLCGALAGIVQAEDPVPSLEELHDRAVANWPAPLLWAPSAAAPASNGTISPKSTTFPTSPLPFVAISPCRLADTRDSTKPPGYGPPALAAGAPRNFTVTGQCGIAAEAAAVSVNLTVVNTLGNGYILAFPQGGPFAPVSTLNYVAAQTVANAAIVPVGDSGGITIDAGVSGTDLIIDVNGYYANNLTAENGQFTLTSDVNGGPALKVENSDPASGSGAAQFTTDSCANDSFAILATALSGTSGCGSTFGLIGQSNSPADGSAGVLGGAFGNGNPSNYGVMGNTSSSGRNAAGVKGIGGFGDPNSANCALVSCNAGVLGVNKGAGETGVLGVSESYATLGIVVDSSGNGIVYGYAGLYDGSNYWGLFAAGDSGASGTKSFVEPHPKDASKIIRYVSLEGPEAGTYFRGSSETHGGMAVIEVPESFRMVTETDGLTVQLTPTGELASLAVVTKSLDRIVVQSSKDVHFDYQVNGVRHGYASFDPISTSAIFAPHKADEKIPAYLNDTEKGALISNGTYNTDGTVNLETAKAQAWDRAWQH